MSTPTRVSPETGNGDGRFSSQTVDLIKGLKPVLKKSSLLAYFISMTLRIRDSVSLNPQAVFFSIAIQLKAMIKTHPRLHLCRKGWRLSQ